jgi:hypothetical protein
MIFFKINMYMVIKSRLRAKFKICGIYSPKLIIYVVGLTL